MDASSPPDSLGYVRMTNSLRNNSFDWFVEERKLVMLPRIKLLLGLVLNFIKWISEKRIHIHFRPKSWIIKRIYNCTLFSPQAQPAKISYVHVTGYFMFFSETVRSELNQVHCMWVWITAWPPEHTETNWELNSSLWRKLQMFLIMHKYFPGVIHPHSILDSDHNMIKNILLTQHYGRHQADTGNGKDQTFFMKHSKMFTMPKILLQKITSENSSYVYLHVTICFFWDKQAF